MGSAVLCQNKSLIKPQNYTENAEMFNFGVIVIRSFCPCDLITGLTAESRNCFHIPVIWIPTFGSCDQIAG
jgi:hypothetical protein